MKILIVQPSLWIYGGAERVIVKLANYLTDKHHEVSILCWQMNEDIRKDLKEARIIEAHNLEEMSYFLQEICTDFDVINIHNEPGYMMLYPRNRNVVWSCNEPPHLDNPTPSQVEKDAVSNFKVIVADKFNKERIDTLYGVDSEIIPYGIDYEFFSKDLGVEKFEDFTLIQVGFLADTKNQLRTLEIFKKIKEKIPNAKLKLVGKALPDYKEKITMRLAELGLMDSVEHIEFCDREKVRVLYQRSHAAIFPIKSQGGWLSVFEAMSAGLPVFVSEEATCSSLLKENNIGYVCKTDEDFVNDISDLKDDEQESNAEWVKENLTWDNYCQKMEEVFNETNKSL